MHGVSREIIQRQLIQHPISFFPLLLLLLSCPFLSSECTSTPSGLTWSLTDWTWSPSALSPWTPSSTPGSLSSSPPACCTFAGPRSAGPLWESPGVRFLNHRWPERIRRQTWNWLAHHWTLMVNSKLHKLYPLQKLFYHNSILLFDIYIYLTQDWIVCSAWRGFVDHKISLMVVEFLIYLRGVSIR